ncbi:MAG: hypothetical protein RLZZ15_1239 [Verrucomicrobiota bacterium]
MKTRLALRLAAALALAAAAPLAAQLPPPPPSSATLSSAEGAADFSAPLLTAEQLEQLLGPIALYPDALIAIVLPAATAPVDLVLAARFLKDGGNPAAVDGLSWDESVKSLAHYPDVAKWMDDNLTWTKQLGEAFRRQPAEVMQAIQRLRVRARANGALADSPQQQVIRDQDVIRIIPAQSDVIFVPYYDAAVVFVDRPVYYPSSFISFGIGYRVGPWLRYDFDWHRRTLWVAERHWNPRDHRDWRHPVFPGHATYVADPHRRPWQPPATHHALSAPPPRAGESAYRRPVPTAAVAQPTIPATITTQPPTPTTARPDPASGRRPPSRDRTGNLVTNPSANSPTANVPTANVPTVTTPANSQPIVTQPVTSQPVTARPTTRAPAPAPTDPTAPIAPTSPDGRSRRRDPNASAANPSPNAPATPATNAPTYTSRPAPPAYANTPTPAPGTAPATPPPSNLSFPPRGRTQAAPSAPTAPAAAPQAQPPAPRAAPAAPAPAPTNNAPVEKSAEEKRKQAN